MNARPDILGLCALTGALLLHTSCNGDDRNGDATSANNALEGDDGIADEEDLGGLDDKFDLGADVDWGDGGGEGAGDEGVNEDGICEIDFLFVIDNSGSMGDEQQNLAASVPDFIETVTMELPKLESYHIGVITTDSYRPNSGECRVMGGLVTQTGGPDSSNARCGPYAGGRNFMTERDDLNATFTCAARPGTGGDGDEKPIEAMIAALTGPPSEPEACNAGFLRRDALLVVVLITDEEDDDESQFDPPPGMGTGSPGEPADWHTSLLAAKGGDKERVVVLGLLGTPSDNVCVPLLDPGDPAINNNMGTGAVISERLVSFVEMFGERGTVGDVCAPNYDPFFDEAVSVIEFACKNLPPG